MREKVLIPLSTDDPRVRFLEMMIEKQGHKVVFEKDENDAIR